MPDKFECGLCGEEFACDDMPEIGEKDTVVCEACMELISGVLQMVGKETVH